MDDGGLVIVNAGSGASPGAAVAGSGPPSPSAPAAPVVTVSEEQLREVIVKDGDPLPLPEALPPHGLMGLTPEALKARVHIIAALKHAGYSRPQIAKALGLSVNAVHYSLRVARQRKLLESGMVEALREIDEEAVPLAVEGLMKWLRKGDKDMIQATLEGRGLFRQHQVKDTEDPGAALPQLQINILNAPSLAGPPPAGILGTPRGDD
jgi:predicted transcriptional regulator